MWIETCHSTMDEIKKIPAAERAHGQWIATKIQQSGRGRSSHTWVLLEGNLAVSVWLDQNVLNLPFTWIPLWIGHVLYISILEIRPEYQGRLRMKWPNDLLLDGQKVSGILCEGSSHWIAAGIGVNCAQAPENLSATMLDIARTVLLDKVLISILRRSGATEPDDLRRLIESCLSFQKGDLLTWSDGSKKGIYQGLGPDGELCVEREGYPEKLWAEEVYKIRDFK